MKKILLNILLIIIIGIFAYCYFTDRKWYKGIKKIENVDFVDPVELKLEKIYSIDSTKINRPVQSCLNSKDELYVLEYFSQKVKVFKNGELLRKYDNICDSSFSAMTRTGNFRVDLRLPISSDKLVEFGSHRFRQHPRIHVCSQ